MDPVNAGQTTRAGLRLYLASDSLVPVRDGDIEEVPRDMADDRSPLKSDSDPVPS